MKKKLLYGRREEVRRGFYMTKTTFATYVANCVEREEEKLYGDFIRMDKRKVTNGSGWEVNHKNIWRETCSSIECLGLCAPPYTYYINPIIKSRFPEFSGRCLDCIKYNIPCR